MRKILYKLSIVLFLLTTIGCSNTKESNQSSSSEDVVYKTVAGMIYSTSYSIKYSSEDGRDLKAEIEAEMNRFGNSLSTFNKNSTISLVNQNKISKIDDPLFIKCFKRAQEISEETDGAFDMTVAPLVNAWGFGFKDKESNITSEIIDSIKQYVGYQKIELDGDRIVKQMPEIMLDASAIAKGLSVDIIASFLNKKGIKNYMVEIGGEIVATGVNPKGVLWRLGVSKPVDSGQQRSIQRVVSLGGDKVHGMATSGNYLNYYIKDGKKYAHTIDPKSGYPVQYSIVSATVIASDCMTADAFATSFMVMGLERAKEVVLKNHNIEAFFIYDDGEESNREWMSEGFKSLIK